MKIHLFKFIFLFLVVAAGISLVGGYFNLIPKAAIFMGTNKPRDLGVKYSEKTIEALTQKSGISSTVSNNNGSPEYKGVMELDIELDSQEITAWARDRGWKSYPVSNAQIKINNNGSLEAAALIDMDKLTKWVSHTGGNVSVIENVKEKIPLKLNQIPVYAKGTVAVENNQINIYFDKLSLSNIPIPEKILTENKETLETFIEDRIKFVPGLYVEKLKFEEGKMKFSGTVPKFEQL